MKRFSRWRSRLPRITQFLLDEVCARVVPEFERHGFEWLKTNEPPNYLSFGYLTFLRRQGAGQGEDWAVVVIMFAKWGRPYFFLELSLLPPVCRELRLNAIVLIPREKAYLGNGPVRFRLSKGGRSNFSDSFGFDCLGCLFKRPWALICYALDRRGYIRRQVDRFISCSLPKVFRLFDEGIPAEWYVSEGRYLNDHFILMGSWHMDERGYKSAGLPVGLPNEREVDAPEMEAAIARARSEVGQFIRELANPTGSNHAVKVPIVDGSDTEHFWLTEVSFRDGEFKGIITNDPGVVGNVRFGQSRTIKQSEISDWMFMRQGRMYGNYTLRPLLKAMPASEAARLRAILAEP